MKEKKFLTTFIKIDMTVAEALSTRPDCGKKGKRNLLKC